MCLSLCTGSPVVSTIGAFGSNEFMEKMCGESTVVAARAAQKAGGTNVAPLSLTFTQQRIIVSHAHASNALTQFCSLCRRRALRVHLELTRGLVHSDVGTAVRLLPRQRRGRSGSSGPVRAVIEYMARLDDSSVADMKDLVGLMPWSACRFPETGVSLRPGFIYGPRRTDSFSIPLQLIGAPLTLLSRNLGAVSAVVRWIPFFGEEMHAAVPVAAVAKAAVLCAIGPVHGLTLDTTNILALADSFHKHNPV